MNESSNSKERANFLIYMSIEMFSSISVKLFELFCIWLFIKNFQRQDLLSNLLMWS